MAHHSHDLVSESQSCQMYLHPFLSIPLHQLDASYSEPMSESTQLSSTINSAPVEKYPKCKSYWPNDKHEIISWTSSPPPQSYIRSGRLSNYKVYIKNEGINTGLKDARNNAGMARPHAFIRKKCQSRILCSRVVRASCRSINILGRI